MGRMQCHIFVRNSTIQVVQELTFTQVLLETSLCSFLGRFQDEENSFQCWVKMALICWCQRWGFHVPGGLAYMHDRLLFLNPSKRCSMDISYAAFDWCVTCERGESFKEECEDLGLCGYVTVLMSFSSFSLCFLISKNSPKHNWP